MTQEQFLDDWYWSADSETMTDDQLWMWYDIAKHPYDAFYYGA